MDDAAERENPQDWLLDRAPREILGQSIHDPKQYGVFSSVQQCVAIGCDPVGFFQVAESLSELLEKDSDCRE